MIKIPMVILLVALPLSCYSKTFDVAVICPITNSSKTFGIGHLQGITLAVEEHNRKNPNIHVNLIIKDDESSPAEALSGIRDAIDSESVAVLGPCNSSVAKHIVTETSLGIPILAALTTSSELLADQENYFFYRANVPDSQRMEVLLDAIFSRTKPNKLTILYEKDDVYGEGLRDDATRWLAENQEQYLMKYVSVVGYLRDAERSDIRSLVETELSNGFLKADHALLMLGIASDARNIITEVKTARSDARLYFTEPNHYVFQTLPSQGINIDGLRVVSVWDPDNRFLDEFKREFFDKFAEEPTFSASLSYDAANILLWALRKALEDKTQSTIDLRVTIKNLLAQFSDDQSDINLNLTGRISFENNQFGKLRFVGLQYAADGSLHRWSEEKTKIPIIVTDKQFSIEMPNLLHIFALLVFGMLGGAIREFQISNLHGLKRVQNSIFKIETFVDALIALITASSIIVLVLITDPSVLTSGANLSNVYYFSAICIGALSGFLGIKSIHAILDKVTLGVRPQQQP